MRFAIVKDGVVTNVIVYNPVGNQLKVNGSLVSIPDGQQVEAGDTWDGLVFKPKGESQ